MVRLFPHNRKVVSLISVPEGEVCIFSPLYFSSLPPRPKINVHLAPTLWARVQIVCLSLWLCDEMVTCPGCYLLPPLDSWDWLLLPGDPECRKVVIETGWRLAPFQAPVSFSAREDKLWVIALIDRMFVALITKRLSLPAFHLRNHASESHGWVLLILPDSFILDATACFPYFPIWCFLRYQTREICFAYLSCNADTLRSAMHRRLSDFKACRFLVNLSLIFKDALHHMMALSTPRKGWRWRQRFGSWSSTSVVYDHTHHVAACSLTQGLRSKQARAISRQCSRWLQPWGEASWAAEQEPCNAEERRGEAHWQHNDENYSQPSGSKWVFTLNGDEGGKKWLCVPFDRSLSPLNSLTMISFMTNAAWNGSTQDESCDPSLFLINLNQVFLLLLRVPAGMSLLCKV